MAQPTLQIQENGFYGVLIHNDKEYSDKELRAECMKYGKPVELHKGGRNLVFIYFKLYEEANACLEALRSHPDYNAKPAKHKGHGNKNKPRASQPKGSPNPKEANESLPNRLHNISINGDSNSGSSSYEGPCRKQQSEAEGDRPEFDSDSRLRSSETGTFTNTNPPKKSTSNLNTSKPRSPNQIQSPVQPNTPHPPAGSSNQGLGSRQLPKSPFLISLEDVRVVEAIGKDGTKGLYDIFLANFPLWFMMADVFDLCAKFVRVLHIDMFYSHDVRSVPYAILFVGSVENARYLVSRLHHATVDRKLLICKMVEDMLKENSEPYCPEQIG